MSWMVRGLQHARVEFVLIAREADSNISETCRRFGVSRKTGYKWLDRYKTSGLDGLVERSRRPKFSPLQLSGDAVVELVKLHEGHEDWGPKKLRARLKRNGSCPDGKVPSLATVARLARRMGWTEAKGRGRPPVPRAQPTEPLSAGERPNRVWTADFKGWWRTGDGRRCEPLTIRDLFSRYILCLRPMAWRSTEAVKQAFIEAFQRYGLPDIIRSDNGSPFACITGPAGLTRLSAWWLSLGIKPERTQPGHPEQNGGHERMHGDIARVIEAHPAATLDEETVRLERWRVEFNTERPHEALGMQTPGDIYRCSSRRLSEVKPYVYPTDFEKRLVNKNGCIHLRSQHVDFSAALGGMEVGIEPSGENRWRVWFCDLVVGGLESKNGRIRRCPAAENPPPGNKDCNPCPDNKV
jgi:transposase InsO family protein